MIDKKNWDEFRATGLVLIVNQILHIFGWAIAYDINDKNEIIDVYPARVKFRGFSNESTTKSYIKVSEFMHQNSEQLLKEAKDE